MSEILKNKKIAFHLRIGSSEDVIPLMNSVEEFLVKRGINTLILEINTGYKFNSHPELSEGTLCKQDAKYIVERSKILGIEVIPLFECLGHQGWGGSPNSILRVYPELDESPYIPYQSKWPEIYCRSWCPNHPDIYKIVFPMIEELLNDFEAKYFHVGMDEVFILADEKCPRCHGQNKAELFANVVNKLYSYIAEEKNTEMILWADRLLDKNKMGYSIWDADNLGIWPAIDKINNDIILADWHYDKLNKYPSVEFFAEKGFRVWPSCWKDKEAAISFFDYSIEYFEKSDYKDFLYGLMVTGWNLSGRSIFETVKEFDNFKEGKEIPDNLKDTFDVLDTLDSVYYRFIK
ncbi:family 20 glycosylhydrolase [Caldicellulosiruptoraceae bacterium PP1]